jgi:hypothetical protein
VGYLRDIFTLWVENEPAYLSQGRRTWVKGQLSDPFYVIWEGVHSNKIALIQLSKLPVPVDVELVS